MDARRRMLLSGTAWTAASAAALYWLSRSAVSWEAVRPSTCLPDACFCEAVRSGPIRQPSDTWSCLAYVFVGGLILGRGGRRSAAFGALAILLGLFSVWFHASLSFRAEWFDAMSLILIPGFLLACNAERAWRPGAAALRGALAAFAAAGGLFFAVAPAGARKPAIVGLIGLYLLSEAREFRVSGARGRGWFWAALGSFAAAFAFWWADFSGALCSPDSLWQGHAAWHALCAVSIGALFLDCRRD